MRALQPRPPSPRTRDEGRRGARRNSRGPRRASRAPLHPPVEHDRARDRQDEADRLPPGDPRLSARALAHVDGHLLDGEARVDEPQEALHLRRAGRIRLCEDRERGRGRGEHAARGISERTAELEPERTPEQAGAEPPCGARLVAIRRVALAGDEARPDRDVAFARADAIQQATELLRRMLSIRVDSPAEGVVLPRRILVAGGDDGRQAAVLGEAEHIRAPLPRELGGSILRAVVDNEDVRFGKLFAQLVQDSRKRFLLVESGDEDDGVCPGAHARSSAPKRSASADTIRSRSPLASSSERVRSGDWNSTLKAIDFLPSGIWPPR